MEMELKNCKIPYGLTKSSVFLFPLLLNNDELINNSWFVNAYNINLDKPWLNDDCLCVIYECNEKDFPYLKNMLTACDTFFNLYHIRIDKKWKVLAAFKIPYNIKKQYEIIANSGNILLTDECKIKIINAYRFIEEINIPEIVFNSRYNFIKIEDILPLEDYTGGCEEYIVPKKLKR